MKKSLLVLLFIVTLFSLFVLGACEKPNSEKPEEPTAYTYTQTVDTGITLTATQGEKTLSSGDNVTNDKSVTINANATAGTVKLFVNDVLQSTLPYTFTPSKNVEVRAELWYAVKVKVNNPNSISASAIILQENGFDATLNSNLEYETTARVGSQVTFKAVASGWDSKEEVVTVDGEKTVELSLDTPSLTSFGGIVKSGNEYFAEGLDFGNAVFEGLSDTNYVFSFKVKNIEAGDYDIVSFGALIDYIPSQSHTTLDIYYAPLANPSFYGFEYISFNAWERSEYSAQSNLNVKDSVDAAMVGSDGSLTFEVVRNNDKFYVFVNETYCIEVASADILGTGSPIKDRASSFGFFTRAKTKCTFYDVNFALGETAVTERLAQGKVSIPAATATNGTVTVTENAYENQLVYATLAANEGYELESVTVGGVDMTAQVSNGVLAFYAKSDASVVAVFKEIPPTIYTISGLIDVKTYDIDIPYTEITATASNGKEVTVNSDYTYSVLAEEGELTLSFAAENFETVTQTFNVTGDESNKDFVIDQPVLTIWAPSVTAKTAKNQYTITASDSVVFNPSAFLGVSSKFWTIESKVSLSVGEKTDYGVGFMVGSGDCAIVLAYTSGAWQLEMISSSSTSDLWGLNRIATSFDITSAMEAAKVENGYVTIKAVRADTIIAMFVNGTYAGSFMTGEYVSDTGTDLGLNGNAGFIGLYERGCIGCIFSDVWYDLDEATAKNAFDGIETSNGNETLTSWGLTVNQDGTVTSLGEVDYASAGYASISTTSWVMETTISGVEIGNEWGVWSAGFLIHGWTSSMLNLYYDSSQQVYCFEAVQTSSWSLKQLTTREGVDLKGMMEKAMKTEGGSITIKVARAGSTFYVFANGVLATTATLADFGITGALNAASHSFGLQTRANTKCTFSSISYSINRIDVYNTIKGI